MSYRSLNEKKKIFRHQIKKLYAYRMKWVKKKLPTITTHKYLNSVTFTTHHHFKKSRYDVSFFIYTFSLMMTNK